MLCLQLWGYPGYRSVVALSTEQSGQSGVFIVVFHILGGEETFGIINHFYVYFSWYHFGIHFISLIHLILHLQFYTAKLLCKIFLLRK